MYKPEEDVTWTEAQARLPPPVESSQLLEEIDRQVDQLPILVVLDDDPTGSQTCHGINVLTVWDEATLVEEFSTCDRGFFILTNSRALPTSEARGLISQVCTAVKRAAAQAQKTFEIVLRGDSALRGHFPDEIQVAEEVIGQVDGWILAPFFRQGGRFTIDNVHYVADAEGNLVPAAQTIFATDATFGYSSSSLIDYVVEKSNGSIPRHCVRSISLQDIREGGVSVVAQKLLEFAPRSVIIVNAIVDTDLEIFVLGLLQAKSAGRNYLYRTGAAFVSTRLAMRSQLPLSARDLGMDTEASSPGGLIIAGSYVSKTTDQLQHLTSGRGSEIKVITLDVEDLLRSSESNYTAVIGAANEAGRYILDGQDVVLMTSRRLISSHEELSNLHIGSIVSSALSLFLRLLIPRSRYIIAKGGITSSDIATRGMRVRRAQIIGQASAGVPVWRCDEPSSKFPGIPYVIFPGNVGHQDALLDLVTNWESRSPEKRPKMQYQRLGNSGLKVSKIILGCMTFGNPSWEGSPWVLPDSEALPLLKKAYDCGINTWDTADTYSNGMSEILIGKALEQYNIPRSKVVIMTKLYYPVLEAGSNARPNPAVNDGDLVNQMGLSRKHIFEAVDASLARLKSSYIDVLQLHRIDDTHPEEVMRALHDLVQMGKVHYLGASSMYCWQLARLQYAAKMNNWTTFTSMQGLYSLLYREEERETNRFCHAEGIGLIPWSPLARGLLARPWNVKTDRSVKDAKTAKWFSGEQDRKIVTRVDQLARSKGCSMSALAIAWLLKKGACPIAGLNSIERIESASEALAVRLSDSDLRFLEEHYRPLPVQAI
ncbi:NADP-dependent oxidoreductase domain-containing protein [Aspergillus pseudonomiae]|uniref:NADP-dependent oxidoreductase domain-containing protein n=1 Tax=Aspergillus pseudonomiae TaxID=1506151 RepID=A0A5N7CVM8_9EURO|nr:NADP-dependent oxidoreductase domain-containing protein [Aspergillus pseudonomiae]KAE8397643.1 NADP-dependent oxidoreductase domain-containing protein [Aspergillus pseudonomiae]